MSARRRRRPGLAPLELVIALPVLLFVTAAIINLGNAALWRVRGEVVSRDVVWRSRRPRSGIWESPPPTWPDDAVARVQDAPQIDKLADPNDMG